MECHVEVNTVSYKLDLKNNKYGVKMGGSIYGFKE